MKKVEMKKMELIEGGSPNVCAVVTTAGSIAFGLVGLAPLSIAISIIGLYGCEYSAV